MMGRTRAPEPTESDEAAAQCLAGLGREDRASFEIARRHYEQTMGDRRWSDDLMLALRWELAGFSDVDFLPDSATAPCFKKCGALRSPWTS